MVEDVQHRLRVRFEIPQSQGQIIYIYIYICTESESMMSVEVPRSAIEKPASSARASAWVSRTCGRTTRLLVVFLFRSTFRSSISIFISRALDFIIIVLSFQTEYGRHTEGTHVFPSVQGLPN